MACRSQCVDHGPELRDFLLGGIGPELGRSQASDQRIN